MIGPPPSPLSLVRAASTTFSDYWKKLACGVIRSLIFSIDRLGSQAPCQISREEAIFVTTQPACKIRLVLPRQDET